MGNVGLNSDVAAICLATHSFQKYRQILHCHGLRFSSPLHFWFSVLHTTDELRASLSCQAEASQEYFFAAKRPFMQPPLPIQANSYGYWATLPLSPQQILPLPGFLKSLGLNPLLAIELSWYKV